MPSTLASCNWDTMSARRSWMMCSGEPCVSIEAGPLLLKLNSVFHTCVECLMCFSYSHRRFKTLADRQKRVTDEDLHALVTDEVQPNTIWELFDVQVCAVELQDTCLPFNQPMPLLLCLAGCMWNHGYANCNYPNEGARPSDADGCRCRHRCGGRGQ